MDEAAPSPAPSPAPAPAMDEAAPAPEVSVVIVNWNTRDDLVGCLASLRRHPPSRPWEAIVVDNGSTDASLAAVRREAPWARLIANSSNRGLAAANNQGLLAARGQAVVISNPDVVYRPGTIDELWAALERHPRAGFVVPRLLHPDGSHQPSAGDLPSVVDALLGRQLGRFLRSGSRRDRGMWWDRRAHDDERPIGHGAEACYLVRREALAEIGPQDEGFWLDWEGLDWSARAAAAGWEVWLCPASEAIHRGGQSIRQAPLRWVAASHAGMYRYFAKRHRRLRPLLAPVVAVRALVKAAALLAGVPLYDRAHRRALPSGAGETRSELRQEGT